MGLLKLIKQNHIWNLIKFVKRMFIFLLWCTTYILPIKGNKIVFDNFVGKGFGDSPKYIALELLSRKRKLDIVWLCSKGNEFNRSGIRCVKWPSLKGIYELATARIWIDNVRKSHFYIKKKNQFYMQTWHGTYGGKKVEKDAINVLSDEYVKLAIRDSRHYDIFLTNSFESSTLIRKSFWYEGQIVETGLPRNDILFKSTKEVREKMLDKLNLRKSNMLVLYAPTFRDDMKLEVYNLEYEKCLISLKAKFGKEPIILIRLHPNLKKYAHLFDLGIENVINVTEYDDMQELLAASDILITDYSSIYLDFIMMRKPVFLYVPDYQKYKNQRDFYISYDDIFISKSEDSNALIKSIYEFDCDSYLKKNAAFLRRHPIIEDGNSSYRAVNLIISEIENLPDRNIPR